MGTPSGVIRTAYHSRTVCCFTILLIKPGVLETTSSAVLQLVSDTERMSGRSSAIRFWKRRRKNGVAIQSRGSDDTVIKDDKVLTTARRTFGIVWRKNGNNVGARSVRGRLIVALVRAWKKTLNTYDKFGSPRMSITWLYVTNLPVDN